MRHLFWLVFGVAILSGCATGYQKQSITGGFTETKIQEDVYKVRFRGNSYCRLERAEDFTLLRSAEVALENGFKYFVIVDERSGTQTSTYTTPVTATTSGSLNTYGNTGSYSGTTTFSGGETYVHHKPSASNTIKCFKEKPENVQGIVYDAEQVRSNIKAQYKLP